MWLLRKVGIQKISLRVMLIEFAELTANIEIFFGIAQYGIIFVRSRKRSTLWSTEVDQERIAQKDKSGRETTEHLKVHPRREYFTSVRYHIRRVVQRCNARRQARLH